MDTRIHPVVQAVLGGILAAALVAIPLVDDGLTASEIISLIVAGITGTGLVTVSPTRKDRA